MKWLALGVLGTLTILMLSTAAAEAEPRCERTGTGDYLCFKDNNSPGVFYRTRPNASNTSSIIIEPVDPGSGNSPLLINPASPGNSPILINPGRGQGNSPILINPNQPNFPGRGSVVLYEDENLQGRRVILNSAIPNLGSFGFNDRTSSLIVNGGNWLVCTDADFRGTCRILGPGTYPSTSALGLGNDTLSSARPQ